MDWIAERAEFVHIAALMLLATACWAAWVRCRVPCLLVASRPSGPTLVVTDHAGWREQGVGRGHVDGLALDGPLDARA